MATRVETSYGSGTRRIGLLTWAEVRALDTSGLRAGDYAEVSDLGYSAFVWNGTLWRPRCEVLLAASAVAVSVTGTTSETALATVTIPAGAMGLNGGLEIRTVWSYTNSANSKTLRARLGGIGGTQYLGQVSTTSATYSDIKRIRNRNSASSQVGSTAATAASTLGVTGAAVTASSLDMAVAQDMVFTGQLALGTETITLESREVWLLP